MHARQSFVLLGYLRIEVVNSVILTIRSSNQHCLCPENVEKEDECTTFTASCYSISKSCFSRFPINNVVYYKVVLSIDVMQANPPQLHSNLLYIQRYRRESRLVSEAAYFFTNMQSVESFISNIDAKALSMDEIEFEKNMESAQALLSGLSTDLEGQSYQRDQHVGHAPRAESTEPRYQSLNISKSQTLRPKSSESRSRAKEATSDTNDQFTKVPSLSDLENKGAEVLLKEDQVSQVFKEYPYLFAQVGDLTINDVEDLLSKYQQLVLKYVSLSKGLGVPAPSIPPLKSQIEVQQDAETLNNQEDRRTTDPNDRSTKDTGRSDVNSDRASLLEVENLESQLAQYETVAPQGGNAEETSQ